MKIAITGSHGLVGSALLARLEGEGHSPLALVRTTPAPAGSATWNVDDGIDPTLLEGVEAVVHLAGESIAAGRWTEDRKRRLVHSRVQGTVGLSRSLARMERPPQVLVSASAIGYYGDRGDQSLSEESGPGTGFLADLCQRWEAAAAPAEEAGVRVVHLRFGIILSAAGGALPKMLPPFRLGLGGNLGSGKQYMSWISLDDAVGAIRHALSTAAVSGAVNAVSPSPVTNEGFTRTLGKVLRRPTVLPLPAFAARLLFGEMADDLLLASTRVEPSRLRESGYRFRHPDLESALRHLLGRPAE